MLALSLVLLTATVQHMAVNVDAQVVNLFNATHFYDFEVAHLIDTEVRRPSCQLSLILFKSLPLLVLSIKKKPSVWTKPKIPALLGRKFEYLIVDDGEPDFRVFT